MHQRLTALLLHWLRVPPEPQAPHGDPASLRVFRAGRHFLNLRLLKWGAAQVAAMAGIIFWFGVFSDLNDRAEEKQTRDARAKPAAVTPAPAAGNNAVERAVNTMVAEIKTSAEAADQKVKEARKSKRHFGPVQGFYAWRNSMVSFLSHLPHPALLVISFIEVAGVVLYVLQLPVTLFLARLDFEQRWYMVTDRSLRIRHGVWKVNESTMSFANIQQVVVSQGPLQRLLGLANVKVQSAGGGGEQRQEEAENEDMHHGLFHSVTNAPEIRDLILERLRRFRESGLGDPDEKSHPAPVSSPAALPAPAGLLAAARELSAEVRALRGVRETLRPQGN